MKNFKCCICGKNCQGFGNNPRPVREKGQCCDECNFRYVAAARINLIKTTEQNIIE
jgi:hypothetical protein